MNTRQLLIVFIMALGAIAISCNKKEPVKPEDMNILFISVEDWNATAVGYENPLVHTPNVDKLAQQGIRFNRAYCQGVVCNPSRASFTTGLRPDATHVFGNGDHYDIHAPNDLPYIANVLKQKGAHTAQTGKLMHKWKHAFKVLNKFDQVEMEKPFATNENTIIDLEPDRDGFTGITKYNNLIPEIVPNVPERNWTWVPNHFHDSILVHLDEVENAKLAAGEPDSWNLRKAFQQYHAEQLGDAGFLSEHTEDGVLARLGAKMIEDFAKEKKQFFLNVGFYAPHTPLLAPKKYMNLYDTSKIEISQATHDKDINVPNIAIRNGKNYDIFNGMYPQFAPTPDRQKLAIASHWACVSLIDEQIGVLLESLEKNGLADNTIVIVFADHGFHLGEHGCWSKFTLFEQSTRIPLIVYVPGANGNGQECNEIVELVDLLPTMCDLWNIDKDSRYEGISFTPLLENPDKEWKKAAFTIVPNPLNGRSIRTKKYKYAEYTKTKNAKPGSEKPIAIELYDLENDPYEHNNLAGISEYHAVENMHREMLHSGWKSALPDKE